MILSNIFNEIGMKEYQIENEQPFDYLALASSNAEKKFLTFLDDIKYLKDISRNATMVLINREIMSSFIPLKNMGVCIVEQPRELFFKLHNYLCNDEEYRLKEYISRIGKNNQIATNSYIAEKNVTIGDNVIIEPFVTIYENVKIGNNVTIRSGARIGSEGYEFKKNIDEIMPVKHAGSVVIESNVEVQCNTTIDKAVYPWDATRIGKNTKIDNLVHIAHGVKVGESCMVVAQSGIGGRVTIGDNAWIGFGATIRNGIKIGNNARINMGAVVTNDVMPNVAVSGNFAIEHKKFIQFIKSISGRIPH